MALARNKERLAGFALFVAVFASFVLTLRNGFVGYDDPVYITENSRVQQGLSWSSIGWAFTTFHAGNWHPLTWLSHMLDCQLFGLQPWGHHFTNVLLHALTTTLCFFVLRGMTGMMWPSLAVALLFGVHPLRVESVAWVSERKDVLSALFWMLTIWAYLRYLEEKKGDKFEHRSPHPSLLTHHASRITHHFYILALCFFSLGLMSKPMVVTLPFVLLLLDYWPLRRVAISRSGSIYDSSNHGLTQPSTNSQPLTLAKLLLEKLPFFFLACLAASLTYIAQKTGGALLTHLPFSSRVENALVSYVRYLGKLLLPHDLAIFYPPVSHWPTSAVAMSVLLLLLISIIALLAQKSRPWMLVGWLWFVGTLVPVIGLVQAGEQAMADRYSYLPSIGVLVMVVWTAWERLPRVKGSQNLKAAGHIFFGPTMFLSLTGIAALGCAILTQKQIGYWKDSEALFRHALRVTKGNYLAHGNLGTALEKEGHFAEAADELMQALGDKPDYVEAHNNLGAVLEKLDRPEEAMPHYVEAVRLNPRYAPAHNNLGNRLAKQGRLDEAIQHYQQAVNLQPDFSDALYNLGVAFGRMGRPNEAIASFERALMLQPDSPDVHNNLGVALDRLGRTDEAISHYVTALKNTPNSPSAHFNLGVALARKSRFEEAINQFQEALRLKPDYSEAARNLSALQAAKKKPGE